VGDYLRRRGGSGGRERRPRRGRPANRPTLSAARVLSTGRRSTADVVSVVFDKRVGRHHPTPCARRRA